MLCNSTWQQASLLGGVLFSFYIVWERKTSVYNMSRKIWQWIPLFFITSCLAFESKFSLNLLYILGNERANQKPARINWRGEGGFLLFVGLGYFKFLNMDIDLTIYPDTSFIQHKNNINILLHTPGIFFFFLGICDSLYLRNWRSSEIFPTIW